MGAILAMGYLAPALVLGGVVAVISGLTDIDAITLSTAQLMKGKGLEPSTGWRVVQVGALSNLVFKGGVVV